MECVVVISWLSAHQEIIQIGTNEQNGYNHFSHEKYANIFISSSSGLVKRIGRFGDLIPCDDN